MWRMIKCACGRVRNGISMQSNKITLAWLGSMLILSGCHKQQAPPVSEPPLPPMPAKVQKVEARTYQAFEEVVGTVRARQRASLEAKVTGRIIKLLVAPGQKVSKDELLAEVDAREIQARLDQAMAVRQQAETELKRYTTLFDQGTTTRQELERVEQQYKVAVAAVKEVESLMGEAKVKAPFDGVITRKLAEVGDLALPGRPILEMEDPTSLRFEADVPEALSGKVHLGQSLTMRLAVGPETITGTVSELEPVADPYSRTFRIKIDLPSTPGLRSGVFGRVAVPVSQTTTLRVPASAVLIRGQMEIVFVADKNRAKLRLVKTGKRFGSEVEVVAGLEAGELVVVEGVAQLVDGQPLKIQ